MKLEDILRKFPDNALLRVHAEELQREAMRKWIASGDNPDRPNQIACIRADIIAYACEVCALLADFESSGTSDRLAAETVEAAMMTFCRQQVASELAALQIFLDLLDAAHAIEVHDGVSEARANSWVSQCGRLFVQQRTNATSANALAVMRELLGGPRL